MFQVVSWVSFLAVSIWCWLGLFFAVCVFVLFLRHLAFGLTYSPTCGNSQPETKRFDDRLSLERAFGHLAVWRFGGLPVWPFGCLAVWPFGRFFFFAGSCLGLSRAERPAVS